MKKIIFTLMVSAIAGSIFAQDMMVQEKCSANEVTLEASASLLSAYVWRGLVANNGMVAQPSMTAAKGPLSFSVWGNYNIEGNVGNDNYNWAEYDFTLAYRLPEGLIMDQVDMDVGIVKYEFAGDWKNNNNTEEIFSVLTLGNIILTPVISAYYDINEANGWYGNFALSQAAEISDAFVAEVGASVGYGTRNYNKYYFGENNGSGGANDYNLYVSADYDLTADISLSALLQYTYLDGGVANDINQTDNLLWGGITASYKF